MPRKKYYTVQEASRKLGISKQAVLKAIKENRLKKTKSLPVTKMVLHIPSESITEFLKNA